LSLSLISLLLLFGGLAGFLAGLLGIGGGVVLVPLFLWLFAHADMTAELVVHTAFGTSLAIIIPTSLISVLGHRSFGNVAWGHVFHLATGGLIGGLVGSFLAANLHGELLQTCFGVMQIVIGLKLLFYHPRLPPETDTDPSALSLIVVGFVGGSFSAFFGVGGGVIAVPLMLILLHLPIRLAVGNSSALIVVSSLAGTVSYVWYGLQAQVDFPWSVGYVNLLVVAIVAPSSLMFARLGVRVAHRISQDRLLRVFSVVLIAVGIKIGLHL